VLLCPGAARSTLSSELGSIAAATWRQDPRCPSRARIACQSPDEDPMGRNSLLSFTLTCALLSSQATAGWTALTNQPPFAAGPSFLLMGGRFFVNEMGNNGGTVHWWTPNPDANGSYVNGTWTRVGDTLYDRLYFGSGVLSDGKIMVCGG